MQTAPQLAHFTGDHALTPYSMFGARGVYTWFTSFNAPYMVAWYRECRAGDWEAARHRQERVHAFAELKRDVFGRGNYHGILNKGAAAASDFLVGSPRTRRPYLPVSSAAIAEFRRRVEEEFPDLVWRQ
jgi:dihydrodipicolinate synthase/N-acetylneuraminate lyase